MIPLSVSIGYGFLSEGRDFFIVAVGLKKDLLVFSTLSINKPRRQVVVLLYITYMIYLIIVSRLCIQIRRQLSNYSFSAILPSDVFHYHFINI
ncbi:hypothetical protein D3C85_1708080 [compost metagenome]